MRNSEMFTLFIVFHDLIANMGRTTPIVVSYQIADQNDSSDVKGVLSDKSVQSDGRCL